MSSTNSIAIDSLCVGYSGRQVLRIEKLELVEGSVTALIGPSGCGKTSLLNCMNGLIDPLGGSIAFQISGRMSTSPPRARIGRTFQGFPIVPWLRVRDNFRLRSRILGSAIDPEAELSSVNAAHLLNRFPSTLSGGERAKCAIALALAGDSSILLMDEPFNGLDHWIRKDIVGHVRTQTKARRLVTVIVTHDVFDSCLIADEILLLGGTPTTVQRSLKRPAQGYSIDQIMTEFDRCPDSSRDCSAI